VGIIGRNGAGKSTLLKILSRITEPTTGRVEIRGRVASLLEVGTGFHPELTGRENIYLNGAILGMTRREIRSKFDEIVDFAEIEKFLDTPVKRYSSGMYVRLAFAVAAHLEPEILVVDEVLAVGDASFQKKCLGKMEDVATQESRAVLFVSHQMQMIESLCERAIILQNGQVRCDSSSAKSILVYRSATDACQGLSEYKDPSRRPGDQRATLLRSWIEDRLGNISNEIDISESMCINLLYQINDGDHGTPYPNIHFFDSSGTCAFVACGEVEYRNKVSQGTYLASFTVPGLFLNSGVYTVGVALTFSLGGTHVSFFQRDELRLMITEDLNNSRFRAGTGYTGPVPGVIRPYLKSRITQQTALNSPETKPAR
jgi:lipopolysaccharide transport system ATP-binding protein